MIRAGIIGGSGLTGRELIKILLRHSQATVSYVTSRQYAGKSVAEVFPEFASVTDTEFIDAADKRVLDKSVVDVIFVCLPHTEAMHFVGKAYQKGIRVVDLSADFRIKDVKLYEKVYKEKHKYPELLKRAVYGLPELFRTEISRACIVANPGCYATCTILGAAPALAGLQVESIISDAKSGISGAGIKPTPSSMYISVNENETPYNVGKKHRHQPEIVEALYRGTGKRTDLIFTPQLVPMDRGMLATIYIRLKKAVDLEKVKKVYRERYTAEPFVRLTENISVHNVQNNNFCDIKVEDSGDKKTLLVVSAIDNLLKGASGQAVQNMNIMFGVDEKDGLL
ncbi:MAG: N-acetyl-gamma-glutamyl-phosphate reductase [Spirochaetia bacterium]|nr:N-acetyl-gamma-glutamyl-phosphate reductase [Spirochaetia bacterium]